MLIYKEVNGWELEAHTQMGWTLERVMPTSKAEKQIYNEPERDQYNNTTFLVHEAVVVVKTITYLISKDAAVVSREEGLQAELTRKRDEIAELNKQVSELANTVNKAQRDETYAKERCDDALARAERSSGYASTLEKQLEQLKTAIGTKTYNEVLGAK